MSTDQVALLIPILSVTVSLAALIVWIVMWYRRRMHEVDCRHQERMGPSRRGWSCRRSHFRSPSSRRRAHAIFCGV